MRFIKTASAVVLGLASVAHSHRQMTPPPLPSRYDVKFPDPGNGVERRDTLNIAEYTSDGAPPAGDSSGSPASALASAPTSASQAPGGVFITASSAEPTTPTDIASSTKLSVEASVPASSAATMPQPQLTTGSGHRSPSSPYSFSNGTVPTNSSTIAGSKCSTEGQWSCLSGGKTYQRCAAGLWTIALPVAPGTSCKPGLGDSLVLADKRSSSGFVPRRRFVYEHSRGKRVSSRMG
ncbi:hypothetical protein ACQKWADRAFT_145085 [Trichoderma austrokoningii]